ncbi:hypothetical protein RD02_05950 [Pectobacterium brasiliense]|nr:hypothetical protein RD02_05950 [Pectobacterium brasiliense]
MPSSRTINGKALSADIALNAGDVGAYTKAETDTRVATATTAANNAATAAANANTNANGRVPSGRTINGKALSADIALSAGDVGALPIAGTATAAAKLATPRKINGVAFDGTSDIDLNGSRVWISGEYTPATSTPIVVSHGLVGINPLHCRCDTLLKCVVAEGEYRVGEFAINPMTLFMEQGVAHPYALLPALNTGTVQLNIMHYLAASFKTSTIGNIRLNMANWRCILRVFY